MRRFREHLSEAKKVYSDKQAHDAFMYGHCRSFAHALHSKIGGEVRALHKDGKQLHVFVHKDGSNYDHRGKRGHASMIMDADGTLEHAHRWSEHPVNHEKMKTNPKMIENASKYIDANKHKFTR